VHRGLRLAGGAGGEREKRDVVGSGIGDIDKGMGRVRA